MTCHNRRNKTLTCLKHIYTQVLPEDVSIEIYLTDDGSTDGTRQYVCNKYPRVNLVLGNGNLYWNGGMRLSWNEAFKGNYDYYLWLNDDTFLYRNSLMRLLQSIDDIKQKSGKYGIIVGSTCDPDTGKCTYGGVCRVGKSLKFNLLKPNDEIQPCDTMNGNCVLIHKQIASVTGNLSSKYTHSIGDFDYGLRAVQDGFSCWIAPGYIGECFKNESPMLYDHKLPLKTRINILKYPKGLPPSDWSFFAKRFTGVFWPWHVYKLWMRVLFPNIWNKFILK